MAFTDYSQLFSSAEQKYGLRPGTGSALMSLEDASGNPYAKSPAGAMGPLQLMPGTASDMGVKNPFDPAANIDGGLHYFSNILSNQAHGDYRTAAMGYNAGPNRASFPQSSQSYADQFMARMGPSQQQPGGPPQMPPRTPPMSLGAMMGQQAPVNMGGPPPVNTDVMGTSSLVPQGNSLGAMAQGMPQMPTKAPSKFTAGNILGTLGDALSAYGGKAPTFGPFLREQQMAQQQRDFEMQKFNNELALKMFMMRNGGLDTDVGKKLTSAGIYPGDPRWDAAMSTAANNDLDPIVITPGGPMLRSQITGAPAPDGVTFTPIGGN